MSKKINYILDELELMFPDAKCELNYNTPFQLLISIMLSAQSTDLQVNKVTKSFFSYIKSPSDIIKLWSATELWILIKSIWLYKTKSLNIYNTSKIILSFTEKDVNFCKNKICLKNYEYYWYLIPDTLSELTKLPWVWEKTAKVFLSEMYDIPVVPVDTHIHRVSNRLWLVNSKIPLKTSQILEKKIPVKRKNRAHHLFIFFWRYFCLARSPKCFKCPFSDICSYYKKDIN